MKKVNRKFPQRGGLKFKTDDTGQKNRRSSLSLSAKQAERMGKAMNRNISGQQVLRGAKSKKFAGAKGARVMGRVNKPRRKMDTSKKGRNKQSKPKGKKNY